jgi:peptide chain release factor 1
MKTEEIRVDFIPTDPPSGQKVGIPRGLIRVLHIPTGMSVSVSDRRGQHRARAYALTVMEMMLEEFE